MSTPKLKLQPCPFLECKGACLVESEHVSDTDGLAIYTHWVRCDECGYRSPLSYSEQDAVAKHNRVARGVWLSDEEARAALSACRVAWGPASSQEDGGLFVKLRSHVEGKEPKP